MHEAETHRLLEKILHEERKQTLLEAEQTRLLHQIAHNLNPKHPTPTSITFQEITMLPPVAGNTLVYTGTLAPAGAAFGTGTTFSVVSSDPNATASVDPTGLIVTIALNSSFVDNPASPFNVVYTASNIPPVPSTAPTSITATITPSIPTPPTPSPTGITFNQTT